MDLSAALPQDLEDPDYPRWLEELFFLADDLLGYLHKRAEPSDGREPIHNYEDFKVPFSVSLRSRQTRAKEFEKMFLHVMAGDAVTPYIHILVHHVWE